MPTQETHTTCEKQPREFFFKTQPTQKDQCKNNTTEKKKNNFVKKNET
jgi:hypothetical protein